MKKHSLLLFIFAILTVSISACYAQTAPKIDKTMSVKGLKEAVIVRRDERSIPYIEAKNEADLYFAQGFETARDRLWQMDVFRRVARGELAELFGKQVLNEDKRWRRFGFSEIAEESLKTMDPKLRSALENYARGVNAYIATLDKKSMPGEFQLLQYEPTVWKATDTIVIGKILADGLSTTWWQDTTLANLKQKLSKEKFERYTNKVTDYDVVLYGKDSSISKVQTSTVRIENYLEKVIEEAKAVRKKSLERIGFYVERLAASNNWVISGKRTNDGNAILANDPHLPGTAPGIWYLSHLSTPTMRVSGVTFPGVPGVVLGHNQYIAWGATNVGPDVQDVYFEHFNEKGEYKTAEGWKKPKLRKEVIKVRQNLIKPDTKDEILEVVETKNGLVFNRSMGRQISIKWTARNPSNQEFDAFILLNSAKNWGEFKEALRTYGGASQNFVYADVKGNIGWQVAGRVPIRREGEGAFPYDGATNDGDWLGYIPFDELPNLYNPKSGFIVTANQRIAGTDYKHQQLIRQYAAPWRAKRIVDLISANKKISMNNVNDIQHDVFNEPLSEFAREIVKRKAASSQTLNILKGWDGKMRADSIGATVANSINACVGNKIAQANKPVSGWQIRQRFLLPDMKTDNKFWLPQRFKSWNDLLKICETQAMGDLKKNKRLGEDSLDWAWGKYNTANFDHPIGLANIPLISDPYKANFTNVSGSGQVPNVGRNVSMRLIAKPANWDETRHVIPLGQSGDPQSPHWKDQFESWRTGKPAIFPFSQDAVMKVTKETILMNP